MIGILAQIETGVPFLNWLANDILLNNGPVILLVIVVLIYLAVTLFNVNKRADANETFVLDTAKDAKETKEELIKVKDAFHSFQLSAAKQEGVFLGRIDEISKQVRDNQAKYEKDEKAFKEVIEGLTQKLASLQTELDTCLQNLKLVTEERDTFRDQLNDEQAKNGRLKQSETALVDQRDKLQKEIDSLQSRLKEAEKTLPLADELLSQVNEIPETPTQTTDEKKEDAA